MNVMVIALIVVLVLILIIFILGFVAVRKVRDKIRMFSRLAWGTNSVSEGVQKMRVEYATTPKSVSAMTSLYLPKITTDFPEFKYDEMKKRAENVLVYYLLAIDRQKPEMLTDANRQLKEKLQAEIEMQKSSGKKESFSQIDIHRTEICSYQKRKGRCIITFQSAVQYKYDVKNQEGSAESRNYLPKQAKYDIDLIYVQDEKFVEDERDYGLGLNCPNCGAPLSALGAKVCEYCGSPVIELNIHVWTFSDVREVK